jgi:hypothetical protein
VKIGNAIVYFLHLKIPISIAITMIRRDAMHCVSTTEFINALHQRPERAKYHSVGQRPTIIDSK